MAGQDRSKKTRSDNRVMAADRYREIVRLQSAKRYDIDGWLLGWTLKETDLRVFLVRTSSIGQSSFDVVQLCPKPSIDVDFESPPQKKRGRERRRRREGGKVKSNDNNGNTTEVVDLQNKEEKYEEEVFDPHLGWLQVLPLHEGARSAVIRGDFYVVVPSLFAGLKIDGDDVRVSSKKMMLQLRGFGFWTFLIFDADFESREKELTIRVRRGESRFWFRIFLQTSLQLKEHGCGGGEVAMTAEGLRMRLMTWWLWRFGCSRRLSCGGANGSMVALLWHFA
ncbi:hypothetical protein V8G54_007983 [Vigna mungo]|uniref:Uncharacterized protein n=1 Tax=Vigna mungo TaxID=3915 RepID=A0AAQ3P4D4_VIGMU